MSTVLEALEGAGMLRGRVIGARMDAEVYDLHSPAPDGGSLAPIKASDDDPAALSILRHTAAHVMASVVQKLWPGTQVTIGPTIRDGFYYDFDRDRPFSRDEFAEIEAEMSKQVEAGERASTTRWRSSRTSCRARASIGSSSTATATGSTCAAGPTCRARASSRRSSC
jgi:threonyl-tRNA synthetase